MKPKRQESRKRGIQGYPLSLKLVKTPGSIELFELEQWLLEDVERRRQARRGSTGGRSSSSSTFRSDLKSTGTLRKASLPATIDEREDQARPKHQGQLYRKVRNLR